jgi:cobalt-zinc-cadmium efflux system protein
MSRPITDGEGSSELGILECGLGEAATPDGCPTQTGQLAASGKRNRRRMAWALGLASVYMIVEIVGGLLSRSLALLADAGHMASDVAALGLALWAMRLATKPATPRRTYGYYRAEILAALANGVVLVVISLVVVLEAVRRFREPGDVVGGTMLAVAVGGLLINGAAAWLLEGGRHESLNVRAAWLHVLADALGSIGVILGAVLVIWFGWMWADPAAACLIAALILYSSWSLLRDAVNVLMASAPGELSTEAIRTALTEVNGVSGIHDLHVWTLTSGMVMLTAHATPQRSADTQVAIAEMCRIAQERFDISHCTVQPELSDSPAPEPAV